ncbi:MAG TPA: diguanylate cyclase [Phycisphaerales bacterium]|nr:diguanylate cyclase [Phycisphaerales bacterium]
MNNELRRTLEGDRETKKLAYADQLTGLPNLNLTGQYLQVCFERSGRGEGALALILIDLDHFRRVNDALGQKSGDELLKQVGARLQRVVTEKDTAIARRGEDEFMVVAFMENARVDGEALLARVRGIAHNLLNELAKPFEVKDQKVQVTASLGVALYPGPARDRTELLEQSEHAMYKAKEAGRARVNFYTEEIHNIRERRKYLEQELRQAINMNQFGLLYQPIYDLSTSKAVGVEALLRWNHPTRGMLEPADFLEVAEDSGLIVQIGDLAVQEALSIAKQKFMKRKFLSLNLSFRQLIDSGFAQRFMKHLQMAGVPPHEVIVGKNHENRSGPGQEHPCSSGSLGRRYRSRRLRNREF